MQRADHILTTTNPMTQPQPSTQSSTETSPPNKKIAALFRLMLAAYGSKYRSTYKNERDVRMAMEVWGRALGDRDLDILSAAFDLCTRRYDWPPSLPEFRDAVKAVERPILDRRRTRERLSQLPPPSKRVDPERAAELISGLRSILK